MRLYAWAHGLTPPQIVRELPAFPGLGAVLNGSNYLAALTPGKWIAYVASETQAQEVTRLAALGAEWQLAIVLDERNTTGPSGHYLEPAEYARQFERIKALLPAGVPVSTMGLATRTNWWQRLIWRGRFDDWYHEQLPPADLRSANPNKMGRRELERIIDMGVTVLSPAIFRGWWYGFMQPIKTAQWCDYARDQRVTAVAIWSLMEVVEQPHGLLTPEGKLTGVGRAVQRELQYEAKWDDF